MSGQWRVIVDSWISEDATWYGRRTYVIDGSEIIHSLPAALRVIADGEPADWLDEQYYESRSGRAPRVDYPPKDDAPKDDLDEIEALRLIAADTGERLMIAEAELHRARSLRFKATDQPRVVVIYSDDPDAPIRETAFPVGHQPTVSEALDNYDRIVAENGR